MYKCGLVCFGSFSFYDVVVLCEQLNKFAAAKIMKISNWNNKLQTIDFYIVVIELKKIKLD